MPRPFTFTLGELAKQYQEKENFLCFSVAWITNAREPKFDAFRGRVLEFPNSDELIQKFRELLPELFMEQKDVEFETTVLEGHLKQNEFEDCRGHILRECIKVHGDDFQITLDIDEKY